MYPDVSPHSGYGQENDHRSRTVPHPLDEGSIGTANMVTGQYQSRPFGVPEQAARSGGRGIWMALDATDPAPRAAVNNVRHGHR